MKTILSEHKIKNVVILKLKVNNTSYYLQYWIVKLCAVKCM